MLLFYLDFTDEPSVLEADFYTIAPHALDYNYTISEAYKLSITDKIKKQYFKESINVHDFITVGIFLLLLHLFSLIVTTPI